MRQITLSVLAAGAVLAACATTPSLTPATLTVAQGVTSLDLAYNIAAKAYLKQAPTMPAGVKAKIRPLLQKALPYVQAADQAEKIGDAVAIGAATVSAMILIGQADASLGVR